MIYIRFVNATDYQEFLERTVSLPVIRQELFFWPHYSLLSSGEVLQEIPLNLKRVIDSAFTNILYEDIGEQKEHYHVSN